MKSEKVTIRAIVSLLIVVALMLRLSVVTEAEDTTPSQQMVKDGMPQFDTSNVLQLPANYREWIFVGSSLGLRYTATTKDSDESKSDDETFGHVYINPFGYREFRRTGEFPVGTMFMLEVARKEDRAEPELTGSFAGEIVAVEAAVKSGDRFEDPWTYFSFDGGDETPTPTARRFPNGTCIKCHRDHAETDHVFTQFYPILHDVDDER